MKLLRKRVKWLWLRIEVRHMHTWHESFCERRKEDINIHIYLLTYLLFDG